MRTYQALANIDGVNSLRSPVSVGLLGLSLYLEGEISEKDKQEKERCIKVFLKFTNDFRGIMTKPGKLEYHPGVLIGLVKFFSREEMKEWHGKFMDTEETFYKINKNESLSNDVLKRDMRTLDDFLKFIDEKTTNIMKESKKVLTERI